MYEQVGESFDLEIQYFLEGALLVFHDVDLLVLALVRPLDYHLVVVQLEQVLAQLVVARKHDLA